MPGFAICGRFLLLDSLLTWCVSAALFAAYAAVDSQRVRWRWWTISAVCCALGVLTKGPVALVLVAPVVAAHLWLGRQRTRPTFAHWLAYGAIVCLLAAPWYIAVTVRDPIFAWHFLIDHHLARFFGSEYHAQPFWFYVPIIVAACLPWSLFLIPIGRFLLDRSPGTSARRPPALGFFALWAGWCLLFFSVSQGKLPTYIVPALPAVALLIGYYVQHVLSRELPVAGLHWAYYAAPRLGILLLSCFWLIASVVSVYLRLVSPAAAATQMALGAAMVLVSYGWGHRLVGMPAMLVWAALTGAGILAWGDGLIPVWASRRSPLAQSKAIARTIADGDTPVVCYGGEWWSAPFYLQSQEKVPSFSEDAPRQLRQYLRGHPRCLVVLLHQSDLKSFERELLPENYISMVSDVGEAKAILVHTADETEAPPAW